MTRAAARQCKRPSMDKDGMVRTIREEIYRYTGGKLVRVGFIE